MDAVDRLGAPGPEPLYRRLPGPWSFAELGGHPRTLYVRVREIAEPEGGETLEHFATRLFAHVDSVGDERLILDLRGNGGGNNYLNQPLVHGLIASRAVNRPGRLFVIVDGGTFSAAVSLAAAVERETHALFVGEPTGEGPNSCGDPRRVTLPGSGLVVRISALDWQQSDPRDRRPWIAPDLPVSLTFADVLAKRDPALERILAYREADASPPRPPNQNWGRKSQEEARAPSVAW